MDLTNKIVTNITLYTDALSRSVPAYVYAKQYDNNSRYLRVTVMGTDGQIRIAYGARLNATKPDGAKVYVTAHVESDGRAIFLLDSNLLAVTGKVSCDVTVFNSDGTDDSAFTTSTFNILVNESEYDLDAVASTGAPIDYAGMLARMLADHDSNTSAHNGQMSGKADVPQAFSVTLTSSGWDNKRQTIANEHFMREGYTYTVSPASDDFMIYANSHIYALDITVDHQITFLCDSTPSTDVVVHVIKGVVAYV